MTNKIYVSCSRLGSDELVKILKGLGYKFGYPHWVAKYTRQEKCTSNMPFITIDKDRRIFNGSKGYNPENNWIKFKNLNIASLVIPKEKEEDDFIVKPENSKFHILNLLLSDAKMYIEKRREWIENREKQIVTLNKIIQDIYQARKLNSKELSRFIGIKKYELERFK